MTTTPALTTAETRAIETRMVEHSALRTRFREPLATAAQKDSLRSALVAAATSHSEEVRLVRGYFNDLRAEGAEIYAVQIDNALRLLRSL